MDTACLGMVVGPDLYERCDPIRRQLLDGEADTPRSFYLPRDEDVPLKLWLKEHVGDGVA